MRKKEVDKDGKKGAISGPNRVHDILVLLVVGFITFGETNQVSQVSFKIVVGDLISFLNFFI